jgi:peroxiredoxin family protein
MTAPTIEAPTRPAFDEKLLGFLEAAVSETPVEEIEAQAALEPELAAKTKSIVIVAAHDDLEGLWATLILASTAAASGIRATVFLTFWGLVPFVRDGVRITGENWMQKMLAFMERPGIDHSKLSKMNFLGMGPWMMRRLARQYNVAGPRELLEASLALDVRFVPCQMSMEMFGIRPDQLMEGMDAPVGAASALELMTEADSTLFI